MIIGMVRLISYNKVICHELFWYPIETTYKIDKDNIVVGGFSQGGDLSIDLALNQDNIPLKGFIALNPDKPEKFNDESIKVAAQKNTKGLIITGDKDSCYNAQKAMKQKFDEIGLQ